MACARRQRRSRRGVVRLVLAVAGLGLLACPTISVATCVGDCNGDGQVTVDELVTGVNIALGNTALAVCPQFDSDHSLEVTIDELVTGVNNALHDCPAEPSPTPSPTASVTPTPIPTANPTPTTGHPPTITTFDPMSGPAGGSVTITGTNLAGATAVTFNGAAAVFTVLSGTQVRASVPDGATSGPIGVMTPLGTATSASVFAVLPKPTFSVSVNPGTANVIQGQSITYAVTLHSSNGFTQLASLSLSGLPAGLTATIKPSSITAGQTALLTVSAPASQATGTTSFTVSASATVLGLPESQSANATLSVQPVTTSFLGRAVEDDTMETPLAGVTITFLGKDSHGNPTACAGQTVSDAAGNFAFTNLPDGCVGEQLVRYNGTTATSPPGQHAGVDLIYTIVAHQVVVSPVLVHLPHIEGRETVMVKQNAGTDQVFTFQTIPFLSVTVYAGTTLTLADGTHPDPFPLTAVQVPVDRLPEEFSPSAQSPSSLLGFIVAFQPANAVASQPVAVTFPNTFNTPPGPTVQLFTLDPTRGQMVPYGSAIVSNDGTQIVPNPDPAHPGHNYGLVHFDWHGPSAPPAPPAPAPP